MQRLSPSLVLPPRLRFCGISLAICRDLRTLHSLHRRELVGSVKSASTQRRIKGVYDVYVGGNGYITLNVVQPKRAKQSNANNVIIRLPQGPLFQDSPETETGSQYGPITMTKRETAAARRATVDAVSAPRLANVTSSTVVTINYRLGDMAFDLDQLPFDQRVRIQTDGTAPQSLYYRYPTPVHDTMAGFDWVLKKLRPARLGVMGTHIGGSLALMLALTEPRSVHAVAALDPVCDWTSLDEYCTSPSTTASSPTLKRKQAPKDLVPLLKARERFFLSHERYFDPFASPILFVRSAGKDTPKVFPKYDTSPEHPVPVLISEEPEELDLWDAVGPENTESSFTQDLSEDPEESKGQDHAPPTRRRKALSRWPPYGLDYGTDGPPERYSRQPIERLEVTLPWVRLFTHTNEHAKEKTHSASTSSSSPSSEENELEHKPPGRRRNQNDTVLFHQANEMVDVMRRACFWGKEKGFGEERVTLSSVSIPSTKPAAREVVTSLTGEWFAETFNSNAGAGADGGNNTDGESNM
ncbi:uncharacterized protein BDV17DRAFT_66815 [Aspergillus undulatus]|uniref:uncharacterized protein n=1 Tax=Aspergillus undulatus TaxID=1810928 RepID=UPI003CCE1B14